MSILQWNIRGLRPNFNDLIQLLNHCRPLVLALQETKLPTSIPIHIPNFLVFRHDPVSATIAHGGVMLAVHCSVPCRRIQIATSLLPVYVVCVRCMFGGIRMSLCSLYLPPGCPFARSEIDIPINQIPSSILLLGDFNAHNPYWGFSTYCSRGLLLEDFLLNSFLCLLNTGTYTHFCLSIWQVCSGPESVLSPFTDFPDLDR